MAGLNRKEGSHRLISLLRRSFRGTVLTLLCWVGGWNWFVQNSGNTLAAQQQITAQLTGTLTPLQHRRPVHRAAPACPDLWPKIQSGDAFTTARHPEQGLEVCRSALESACNVEQRKGALQCIQGAIAERTTLDYIDSHLRLLDYYLGCNWCDDASAIKRELEKICPKGEASCVARQEQLRAYIDNELTKRPRLSEKQHSVTRWFNQRSRGLDLCPTPTIGVWVGTILSWLKWLFLVALIVPLLFLVVYLLRYWWRARKLDDKCWIVWSITDDSKCGAAGAVMDSLSFSSNPLLARFLSDDPHRSQRERARREMLLAPPFFVPDRSKLVPSVLVWVDLLEAEAPIGREPAFIELVPFDCGTVPHFILDGAYEEIDISIGGFGMKGILGVFRSLKRFRDRKLQSIIGVVSKSGVEGQPPTWAVRLNANKPGLEMEDRTMSVYADSIPMSFGDPLGQVAERAAFKLAIRIVRPDLDAHDVTAVAAFRQGMELLLQII